MSRHSLDPVPCHPLQSDSFAPGFDELAMQTCTDAVVTTALAALARGAIVDLDGLTPLEVQDLLDRAFRAYCPPTRPSLAASAAGIPPDSILLQLELLRGSNSAGRRRGRAA